ncbi:MAG TPA: hypothetical protein VMN60_12220 [Longimicrobiales bacterium]|nr:hypothetical protein [Longimicrobiales bacterium]
MTLTYVSGTTTRTVSASIVVGNPTFTFDPPEGFVVPYQSNTNVDITISPPPVTAYSYTLIHNLRSGQANTTLNGPTSSATGTETLNLSWNFGGDFTGEAFVILNSNAPGATPLRLGPIPSKSQ